VRQEDRQADRRQDDNAAQIRVPLPRTVDGAVDAAVLLPA
jgi:hypothetical protein